MSRSRKNHKNPYDSDLDYEVDLDRIKPYDKDDAINNYVPPTRQELDKMVEKNKKNQRKEHRGRRVALIILLVFLCICIAIAAAFLILHSKGKKDLVNFDNVKIAVPADIEDVVPENDGKTITYKGRTYRLNENITSIACLGIDKEQLVSGATPGTAGQSDTNIVLAVNTATGNITAINIPRDTMTDVNVYTVKGHFVETRREQLCMAYAYGDGKKTSCENAVTSLERVLFGMPINSYISLDMDGIGVINDAVGGVTVVPNEDIAGFSKGKTVTLHGERALAFVRSRGSDVNASLRRSDRHVTYATAFAKKAAVAAKQDIGSVKRLYNTTMKYCSTNVDLSKATYLATTVLSKGYGGLDTVTIPGDMAAGEEYAEYTVDNEAAFEMILSIYYTEVI